jgi:uncharacterized protein
MGFAVLAPIDRFLLRRRLPIVVTTLALVALGLPLLIFLPFDFNPLHLRNPKTASVATFLELKKDPQTAANAIEIEAPNLETATKIAQRLSSLAEVSRAATLDNLVPVEQAPKLEMIYRAAGAIGAALKEAPVKPPPSDQENIAALSSTANTLAKIGGDRQEVGVEAARRLSGLLLRLAESDPSVREKLEAAVVAPLRISLDQLKSKLRPQRITPQSIPADLARQWGAADGRARASRSYQRAIPMTPQRSATL